MLRYLENEASCDVSSHVSRLSEAWSVAQILDTRKMLALICA